MNISHDYGVLLEDEGISLRGLFIIDPKGTLKWATLFFGLITAKSFGLQTNYCRRPSQLVVQSTAFPSFPVQCSTVKFARLTGRKVPKPLRPIPSPSLITSPLPLIYTAVLPRNALALNKCHVSASDLWYFQQTDLAFYISHCYIFIPSYIIGLYMSLLDLVVTRLTGNRCIHFQVEIGMLLPLWCEIWKLACPSRFSQIYTLEFVNQRTEGEIYWISH